MGMTNKALEYLRDCGVFPFSTKERVLYTVESIDEAIDTIHKYQKIKEIVADWRSDGGAFEMSEPYWLRLISEVVEDGNRD